MMKLRNVLIATAIATAAMSGSAFAQSSMPTTQPAPMAQPAAAPMPASSTMQGGMMTHQEAIPGTDVSKAGLQKDPLIKKRVADTKAKKRYKMKKKEANMDAKEDKAAAKAQLNAEKKRSSMERAQTTPAQIPVPATDRAP